MRFGIAAALAIFALLSSTARADTPAHAAWERMKILVGAWEGTGTDSGTTFPATTKFEMVSANSVLMNTLGEGTPHEMVTMFHMDLQDLMATHYCSAQNQPRFKAVPGGAPNQIVFEFKDGTNIGPNDGHMQRVIFTFVDAHHHTEDWVFRANGQDSTGHFDFHRSPQ